MMNGDELEGTVKTAVGKVESFAGNATGDPTAQLSGEARQFDGKVQRAAGKVQDAVGSLADHATATIATLSERAQALYGQARERAQGVYDQASVQVNRASETVTPLVKERPIPALAIAAAAGFVLGALLLGRGPKVIYLKQKY